MEYAVRVKTRFASEWFNRALPTPKEHANFRILKAFKKNLDLTQRELADEIGLSVGRINYSVNALIGKGAIKIGKQCQQG